MPALTVLDMAMFALETKKRPFGVGPLIVLKPPPGKRRGFADRLVKRMLERPVKAPFDYRLKLGLTGLPSVESVKDVDPAAHIHRVTLHGKATMQELFDEASDLQAVLLDRSKPLWALYVIDGLEDGRVALYGKVHHGIIDGRGLINVLTQWLSTDPAERTVHAMWEGLARPAANAARASLAGRLTGLWKGAGSLVGNTTGLAKLLAGRSVATLGIADGLPLPFLGVPNVLDGQLGNKRSYSCCVLPLPELKAFGKAHQATINDVFLAVLDLALERYLRERGSLPKQPLVVDMPVALAGAASGNQIAVMQFPLGKPGAAPAQRLKAVRENTAMLKRETSRQSQDAVMLYTALAHGFPSLIERIGLGRGIKLANMVVSNPFGLSQPCYLMGAEVEMVLPMSLVAPGQTLNVTAVSLADKFQIGFLALPDAVPEVQKLAQYTVEAFEQLRHAMAPAGAAPAPSPSSKPAQPAARKRAVAEPAQPAAPKRVVAKPAQPVARKRVVAAKEAKLRSNTQRTTR
jgi:diacylglycerol O-acyltransferase